MFNHLEGIDVKDFFFQIWDAVCGIYLLGKERRNGKKYAQQTEENKSITNYLTDLQLMLLRFVESITCIVAENIPDNVKRS